MNKFDIFQEKALETFIVEKHRFWYCLAGLVGESSEMVEKMVNGDSNPEIIKEVGDALWYCAVTSHLTGLKFSEVYAPITTDLRIFDVDSVILQLLLTCGKIAELLKKDIRQNLTNKQKQDIIDCIADITRDIDFLVKFYELGTLDEIFAKNNLKLAIRAEQDKLKGQGDNR